MIQATDSCGHSPAEIKAEKLRRYHTDPEYREKIKRYSSERERTMYKHPEYAAWQCAMTRLKKRRLRKGLRPLRNLKSDEELVEDVRVAHEAWKKVLAKISSKATKVKKQKGSAAGMEIHLANQQRSKDKKAARTEWLEITAAWRKKWAHVLKKQSKKQRDRRDELVKASKVVSDKVMLGQINHIHSAPCHCYWCNKFMPNGGTVDHILALAKGGSHTSGNICASCPECNSKKSDRTPEEVGFQGTLL